MKVGEIVGCLEELAPLAYQEDYDNAGLLVGNPQMSVKKVLLCLDSTEEVVQEAARRGCNLIIAHHPIIFRGLKKINGNNYAERAVIRAVKQDIAIYAAHTNLDNIRQGVNAKISKKLGLVNCKILLPKPGVLKKIFTFCPLAEAERVRKRLFEAGAGSIGNYGETSFNAIGEGTFKAGKGARPAVGKTGVRHTEREVKIETVFPAYLERQIISALLEAHPYEEVAYDILTLDNTTHQAGSGMIGELPHEMPERSFLKLLKNRMHTACIRHTGLRNKPVRRVAVCGGSGAFLLKEAARNKADFFVTADVKYHEFFDAEGRLVIADIGHYESEQFTMEIFYEDLTKKFSTFAVLFSKINTNPLNYF